MNLNNAASNTNTNIGSRHSYYKLLRKLTALYPCRLAKITPIGQSLVALLSKAIEVIRKMKRLGNLYPLVCDEDNIRKAINRACRGKRNRHDVQRVLENVDKAVDTIHEMLVNKTFVPSDYASEVVHDGSMSKERVISKPKFFPDQCIHWAMYLVIKDWIYNGLYVFSCGSVPGRGVHYGKKYMEKWVRTDAKNTKYYLKMDIRKFYPSVQPNRLMAKLRAKIKDEDLLALIEMILSRSDGLPIGILPSQMFANFYIADIDHFIKQELGATHYLRYMDDMVVFGNNKKRLHKMRLLIDQKLRENGLTMKANWQICRFDKEPLDFMGFRFFRDRTILRKSIMYRIVRTVMRVYRKGKACTHKDACAIVSYLGWIKHSDSHTLFVTRIKPYLHIQRMKNIIRRMSHENLSKQQHRFSAGVGQSLLPLPRIS